MPLMAALMQSLTRTQLRAVPENEQQMGDKANLARLPDELIEMIALTLNRQDLARLRLCNKRLAIKTTHLVVANCRSSRWCRDGTEGLKTLIQGSRLHFLNGTVTSLELKSPSWKSPLAWYGAGLRDVRLLRLTSLNLYTIRIIRGSDLLHFLTSHATTLRQLRMRTVHLPDLPSWRDALVRIACMRRLQTLDLRHLYYSAERARIWMLPRSSRGSHFGVDCSGVDRLAVQCLINEYFTSAGQLRKDLGHEQLLAAEAAESWTRTIKRRLLRAKP